MKWNQPENKKLIEALLSLRNQKQAQLFLRDLMTEGEITEFAKRFQTAEMLTEKVPYTTIVEKTGLSSTTVARVAKWLNGNGGGYRSVINTLHHDLPIQSRRGLS